MREKEGICIKVREKEEGQNKDIVLVCKHAGEKSMYKSTGEEGMSI